MPSSVVRDVLRIHRAQLQGLVELRGVKRMRALYEDARQDIQDKLRRLARQHRGQTFSAHHLRSVLAQVEDGVRFFANGMEGQLQKDGRTARSLAANHVVSEVKKFSKTFTGVTPVLQVEQIARMRRVVGGAEPTLLRRFAKSKALYGVPTIRAIEDGLAMSLATGETLDDAVDRVADTDGIFEGQRWRAERIARTELAFNYGLTKQRTMEELRVDVPHMQKKLIETMDNRTGEDSEILDGQIVDVDQPFVYNPPPGKKGYPPFMQPPGRPNDRAVTIPWDPAWGDDDRLVPEAGGVRPRSP